MSPTQSSLAPTSPYSIVAVDADEFVRTIHDAVARVPVEQSPECIMLHAAGRVRYVNPAALALLGLDSADMLVGRSLLDFVHPESRTDVAERLMRAATGATPPTS